jgi:peptidoglycan/xylan/chitin deacetylase (PgdA/CDA1 family)
MFKGKKLIILGAASGAIIGLVIFVRSMYVLPVLMYHSVRPVVPKGNMLTVSTDTFERQMAFLKKNDYNVLPLDSLADYVGGKKRIPSRAVVITFDDGYEDNYAYAFPILKKYGFAATVFIIVSKVGNPGRLSWEQIRQMQDSGLVSFGSHTLTHCFIDGFQSGNEVEREVCGSKQELEEKLGKKVSAFSYPMGRFTPISKQAVKKAGYSVAVATNPGSRFTNQDVLAFKRLRISENARNMFVFWLESSGYYNFIREIRQRKK